MINKASSNQKKKYVVYYPYFRPANFGNKYVNYMMDVLKTKYKVLRIEDISLDQTKLADTQAVILNWAEDFFDDIMRYHVAIFKKMEIPVIWVFHNACSHDENIRKRSYMNMLWLIDNCDTIICHSKLSIDLLKKWNAEKKARYVPLPAYIGKYNNYKDDNRKRLHSEGIVFGQFGSIVPYKNYDITISAFINAAGEGDRLFIAGRISKKYGEYIYRLKELAAEDNRIIIDTCNTSDEDLYHYHCLSDIIVLPYRKEDCINSAELINALSYRKPVIISDIPCAMDIVEGDEKIGNAPFMHIFKSNDIEEESINALADKMQEAIECGRCILKKQGEEGYKYVAIYNNYEVVERELSEAIENSISGGSLAEKETQDIKVDSVVTLYDKQVISRSKSGMIISTLNRLFEMHLKNEPIIKNHNIKSVAVYGYSYLGKRLCDLIIKEGVKIDYVVDRAEKEAAHENVIVYSPKDDLPWTQLMIVTALYDYDEIESELSRKLDCMIVALDDLIEGFWEKEDYI